jgi:hypothetical protein
MDFCSFSKYALGTLFNKDSRFQSNLISIYKATEMGLRP